MDRYSTGPQRASEREKGGQVGVRFGQMGLMQLDDDAVGDVAPGSLGASRDANNLLCERKGTGGC